MIKIIQNWFFQKRKNSCWSTQEIYVNEMKSPTSTVTKSQKCKNRVGFTIEKDLILLRSAVNLNPWQLGEQRWSEIATDVSLKTGCSISKRTAKNRIELLAKKYESQLLTTKTGSEEEQTERGALLQDITQFMAEEKASINTVKDGESTSEIDLNISEEASFAEMETTEVYLPSQKSSCSTSQRNCANKERDELLNSVAPEPNGIRRKRSALAPEDELIMKKQMHDMDMDHKKHQLEVDKLEWEKQREIRIAEENRRKDEMSTSQLVLQKQMFDMMSRLIERMDK